MSSEDSSQLLQYLKPETILEHNSDGIFIVSIASMTPGMEANSWFFSHPEWGPRYFESENHRSRIGERWRAATGSWDDKVVVDLGCGPGNLFRCVDGHPKLLIGVDISEGALLNARNLGYTPLLSDVHNTPLKSGFADLVTANATLHHVDDMAAVLAEAARLVKPGGLLVTDEDPLKHDHQFSILGSFLRRVRSFIPIARVSNQPRRSWKYRSFSQQACRRKTELHNRFHGDGITREMYLNVLEPMGFNVKLYPHGHVAKADVIKGSRGSNTTFVRMVQRASGIDPDKNDSQLSIMCVATRDR
jgi:ubiquinone/menaquinone biosynthesis C-methylase UbiE